MLELKAGMARLKIEFIRLLPQPNKRLWMGTPANYVEKFEKIWATWS
jgi:hypothetical protein